MRMLHGRPHYGFMEDDHPEYDEVRESREDRSTMTWIIAGIVALALVCGAWSVASAQGISGLCGYNKVRTPTAAQIATGAATQQIVVSTTAQSLTIPTFVSGSGAGPVVGAYVQVLVGLVKERHDGTAPTAVTNAAGSVWGPGGTSVSSNPPFYVVCGNDITNLQMIRYSQSATDSTVNVYYYIP